MIIQEIENRKQFCGEQEDGIAYEGKDIKVEECQVEVEGLVFEEVVEK